MAGGESRAFESVLRVVCSYAKLRRIGVLMDRSAAVNLIDILTENAVRILRAGFGVNYAESTFFEVIRVLRQENTIKPHFLNKVRDTLELPDPGALESGVVPRELIELVAHEFRWNEFKKLSAKRIESHFGGDARLAVGDVAHGITEAFADDWQDREFYEHYRQSD